MHEFDLEGLSPRNRSLMERVIAAGGISGGDGDDPVVTDPAPVDPPADPAPVDPPADPPVDPPVAPVEPAAPEASAPIEVADLPAEIQTADEMALRAQHDAYEAAIAAGRPVATTPEQLAALREARTRSNAIATELQRRTDESAEVAAGLAALDDDALPVPAATVPMPVMASAAAVVANRTPQAPARQTAAPAPRRPRAALLASAGMVSGADAAGEMTLSQMGRAMDRHKGADRPVVVASVEAFDDMDEFPLNERLDTRNAVDVNDELIRTAQEEWREARRGETRDERMARVAAICTPYDNIREIPSQFSTIEPVSSIFPARPAGRLGFNYTPSAVLADVSSGVKNWKEADQAAVVATDQATWKPIVDFSCGTPKSVTAEAITAAARFDNTLELSSPERLSNLMAALMSYKARVKEGRVLQLIDSLSGAYTFTGDYGAVPTLIKAINSLVAQMVYKNRLDEPNYVLLVPPGLEALLGNDRAARGYNPSLAVADRAELLDELRGGLDSDVTSIVETLDASLGGEPGLPFFKIQEPGDVEIPVPALAGEYRIRLVEPSAAIYAETGEMNTGVQRSPDLMRQNKAQVFVEEYLMLAKNGPAAWAYIDVQVCDNGARAGLLAPPSCSNLS